MKRVIMALSLILVLVTCFSVSQVFAANVVEIKLTHIMPEAHPYHAGVQAFIESLKKDGFGDNIKVTVFPNAQLGTEIESIESLRMGVIQMAVVASTLSNFVSEVDWLKVPFLYNDIDHFYRVVDGPTGDKLKDIILNKSGLRVLGYFGAGERNLITKKRINSVADMKGVKIRAMQNNLHINSFSAIGLSPVPIALSETYSALETGLVDGVELDPITFESYKLYEVVKQMTLTRHLVGSGFLVISENVYKKLPKEYQEAITRAGIAAQKAEREAWAEYEKSVIDKLKAHGVIINELPVEEQKKMQSLVEEKVYPGIKNLINEELLKEISRLKE